MEAQVYSVEECAQILHIGRQLAYELIRQNKLPAIRLGANPHFPYQPCRPCRNQQHMHPL